jgi:hypothetical protein
VKLIALRQVTVRGGNESIVVDPLFLPDYASVTIEADCEENAPMKSCRQFWKALGGHHAPNTKIGSGGRRNLAAAKLTIVVSLVGILGQILRNSILVSALSSLCVYHSLRDEIMR